MDIHLFTEIMNQAATTQNVSLKRYETEIDFRFGIPDKYVASSFEKNGISTVIEFRVGNVHILIPNFNSLPGVSAKQHDSSKDMLVVRINNGQFTDALMALIRKCSDRAVTQYLSRR